ncbi:N/A [soil metagenome]
MDRSILAVLTGTFTLRLSTGLTGALLVYYLAELPDYGGQKVDEFVIGLFAATFFVAELVLSPFFGLLSDRLGHYRVMQIGPIFGAVAVILTGISTNLLVLGGTRWLEGASTAASVPSILGFIAMVTADDEKLRGGVVARFEAATIAGLGVGIVAAGALWALFGPVSFFLNAGLYGVSWAIYRYGVAAHAPARPPAHRERLGWRRYAQLLRSPQIWLLAPTWIAVNASLGLWTSHSIFQLVRDPDPRFSDQVLAAGFSPLEVSLGLAVAGLIFFAGLFYWGDRFKKYRRTTIIFYGILGGVVVVAGGLLFNHSTGQPFLFQALYLAAAAMGLFVLAGATPAALGLLADISESFPNDRGAVMGLYSVFLALGQIAGAFVGAAAADLRGIDGLLLATLLLLIVALLPLFHLRLFEHRFEPLPGNRESTAEPLLPERR